MRYLKNPAITDCLLFAFFAALLIILYSNTFFSPFTFDDEQILTNYYITNNDISLRGLYEAATLTPNKRRGIAHISFALNHYFSGENVFGYHIVNIVIHIAAAFTFYLLANLTLQTRPLAIRPGNRTREIAFFAALLWAVHPLQTNAVTYIVQRMTSMATLLCMLCLFFYVKLRLSRNKYIRIGLIGAAALSGAMALLSKENSAMLPFMILGYEFFFLMGYKDFIRYKYEIVGFAVGMLMLFVCISIIYLESSIFQVFDNYSGWDFTLGERLLTEARVVWHYLSLVVLPLPSRLNLVYDFPISTGFFTPPLTMLAILGICGLIGGSFRLFKHNRLASFALFWLLLNLVIESSILPLDIIFEHRMYLPAIFLFLAGTELCYRIFGEKTLNARITVVAIVILFSIFTWQRNGVWENEITLWTDIYKKSPNLAGVNANLGKAYAEAGDHLNAVKFFRQAIQIDPQASYAYISLGAALERENRFEEAIAAYKKALTLKKADKEKIYTNLALISAKKQDFQNAVEYASKAIEINRNQLTAYKVLATASLNGRSFKRAESTLLDALKRFPQHGDFYIILGAVYENQNRLQDAVKILHRALQIEGTSQSQAYNNLGIVYWRLGRFQDSVDSAQKALAIDPDLLDAHVTLGITFEDMGQQKLALAQFTTAWQKGYDMVRLYNNWAKNFLKAGQPERAILYLREAVKLKPDSHESHRNLLDAYLMQGMAREAEEEKNILNSLVK